MLSFAILIFELWVLGASGLILHKINSRFGLAPLLAYAATIMVVSIVAGWLSPPVELLPGMIVRPSGYLFVTLVLVVFLTIYIAAGTRPAQTLLLELVCVSAVMVLFLFSLLLRQHSGSIAIASDLTVGIGPIWAMWLQDTVARLVALAGGMVVIAILYQTMRNVLSRLPLWLVAGLSLWLALWLDVALFDLLTTSEAPGSFAALLSGRLLLTALLALAIWPLLAWYLVRVAPRLTGYAGINERPVFDIISGVFGFSSRSLKQPPAEDGVPDRSTEDRESAIALEQAQNLMIREFVRESAHDLKNPLSSIKLKVELLRRIKDSEAQREHLDDLEKRVDHMVNLIDDLSVFTYLNAVDLLVLQPVDMNRLVHSIHQAMLPLAERKGLSLTVDFPTGDALIVWGDHDELLRMLAHLLVNAIHYTDAGGITLHVDRSGEHGCTIKVCDKGRGITAEDLPRIFERGFRASEVVRAGIDGTGLGLAIVRRVVDLHGGEIHVKSVPGQGTTLALTLPLAEAIPEVD